MKLYLEHDGDQLILRGVAISDGRWFAASLAAAFVVVVILLLWRVMSQHVWLSIGVASLILVLAMWAQHRKKKPPLREQPGAMYDRARQRLSIATRVFDVSTVVRVERIEVMQGSQPGATRDHMESVTAYPEVVVCVRVAPDRLEWVFVGDDIGRLGEWVERRFADAMGAGFVRIKIDV